MSTFQLVHTLILNLYEYLRDLSEAMLYCDTDCLTTF
jgi:hypothetical protein